MNITINHQIEEVAENACLHDVVQERLGEKLHGIAVAVNHVVIPRERYATHALQANDNILIIKATQGG
ncbi:thiamine biosynthesis protein ThiS [Chitinophaga parva]|uniref:Thiamine biosynthesis protein ThiS n=1 Tax=Chitinophaga parva TaxID=2169414 RepID=A0A2T7BH45_9BACT|nr:sulfur carrier protein ThiS [Chitinophaga parva]PUZ25600.1 thiamine biosynthesis protein ThiS [Chitinophaga parva]